MDIFRILFVTLVSLIVFGCSQKPLNNYAHIDTIAGAYEGQTGVIGQLQLQIYNDSNKVLSFNSNCGLRGKLTVISEQGRVAGKNEYNDIYESRVDLKPIALTTGRNGCRFEKLSVYVYKTGQSQYGYQAEISGNFYFELNGWKMATLTR